MQIRHISIQNFKGIKTLKWTPDSAFCCLIGSGDVGKTSILDAIEATLSTRWITFAEADFVDCDTSNEILVEVTIGELSTELKSDERFGLYTRGWTSSGDVRDEPAGDDQPVLTVRLSVDATLEPVWELVCDRSDRPRTLSNRDRSHFGLVRLSGSDARHLAWGQGSVLARLTDNTDETALRLAGAYRRAREGADFSDIQELSGSAREAEKSAKELGAYVSGKYQPGLELGRSGFSSGSIALHDSGVPLRQAGLGTKRLATLAIQKSGIQAGAIILIDEIENGLEPHRIIGAISQIKSDQRSSTNANAPTGQILMTTHSDVALAEAGGSSLRIVQRDHNTRKMNILAPKTADTLKPILRFAPRALLAKRVLVIEGYTEVGILHGIKEFWPQLHEGKPIEQLGAALVDGNGHQAPSIAKAIRELGYSACLFRDSDSALGEQELKSLEAAGIPVIQYAGTCNTEQAIFMAADDACFGELLDFAMAEHGAEAVASSIASKIDGLTPVNAQSPHSEWTFSQEISQEDLRKLVGEVAHKKKWFKELRLGREVSPLVWKSIQANKGSDLAKTVSKVENWLYG